MPQLMNLPRNWLPGVAVMVAAAGALLTPMFVAVLGATGASLSVEPTSVAAGSSITVVAVGLEPLGSPKLALDGAGLVLELGTLRSDTNGRVAQVIAIPAHVPTGYYVVRIIGDDSLATAVAVSPATDAGVRDTAATAPGGKEPPWLLVAALGSAIVIVLAGVLVAWRSERLLRAAV